MALRKYIRRICHVYLDNIMIWLSSVDEHQRNVWTILQALREADLYCLVKKLQLFTTELDFLGHHISERGVEPDGWKVESCLSRVSLPHGSFHLVTVTQSLLKDKR